MSKGEVNQLYLFQAISKSWTRETSADPEGWTPDNPAWGQCAVTALTVQDFLGGELVRLDLTGHGNPKVAAMRSHYFNRIGEAELDISSSQFGDVNRFYQFRSSQEVSVRDRSYLVGNTDTVARYVRLRHEVARLLSGDNPLFRNCVYKTCLTGAMLSNCQKGKFGCIVKHRGLVVASGHNQIMECMKDWAEPQCIRLNIQSRTESMIGCCSHAEEVALVQARDLNLNLSECDFYVAGFHSNGLTVVPSEKRFSCIRCATQFYLHKVGRIFVPIKDRWESMTADEAVQTAKKFAIGEKKA